MKEDTDKVRMAITVCGGGVSATLSLLSLTLGSGKEVIITHLVQ